MIVAIDPGMTVTGIVLFRREGNLIKPWQYKAVEPSGEDWLDKADWIVEILRCMVQGNLDGAAIEEPIYSWGRKNPKAFAKQNMFVGHLISRLDNIADRIWIVNPKSMKLYFTGDGKATKDMVIKKATKFINDWPRRKAHREAIGDAVGIGRVAWDWHTKRKEIKGVTLFRGTQNHSI